jgi:phosphoglycolate phosphatase-like HAD superfamily hydrolase
MNSSGFKTWIFDCDGVILNSNSIKSDVFFDTALKYGKENAEKFLQYHKQRGGVSRYEKFRYFFEEILHKKEYDNELALALEEYGKKVYSKMIDAEETEGLREILRVIPKKSSRIVVSGGNQDELRDILRIKGIDIYFDGIFGSPMDKKEIIINGIKSKIIRAPVIFIGDSQYDYEVAKMFDLHFVFMSKYSEFQQWRDFFCNNPKILIINSLKDLIETPDIFDE